MEIYRKFKRREFGLLLLRLCSKLEEIMRNKAELNIDTLMVSSDLSFIQCILELVGNSLNARAAAIAIRIHIDKREIHVIDNGIGIPKDKLERIAESKTNGTLNNSNDTLTNIRQLSDVFTIASRYRDSTETFMKVFKMGYTSNLKQVEQRPSCGTTISVYGFHETLNTKWNMSTVCFLIATISVANLEVSFSIRDEQRKKVVLRIAKSHSPIAVLRTLLGKNLVTDHIWLIQRNAKCNMRYHGYIGLSDENTMQWIFLNHKLIYYPLILKSIEIGFKKKLHLSTNRKINWQNLRKKNIFILLFLTFSRKKNFFFTDKERRYMLDDVQEILNNVRNSDFKCLTGQITDCTVASYSCNAQPVKQMYLKSKKSIPYDDNDAYNKNLTSLMRQEKINMTDLKKKKSTSIMTNYSDKQRNKNDNIKAINYCAEKEKNMLNGTRRQTKNVSVEHAEIYEENDTDQIYSNNIEKMQRKFPNFATNRSTKRFEKTCDYYNNNNNDNVTNSSPLSVWSNWTYHSNEEEGNSSKDVSNAFSENDVHLRKLCKCTKQFDFLPRKLYNLLHHHHHHHVKLTNAMQCLNSPNDKILLKENWQYKKIPVYPCNLKQKLCEFRLSRTSLKYIKIINQVNNEFIAALIKYNKMNILLMMDQHAVHERIRYESLLRRYKAQNEGELLSINLRDPLVTKLPANMCNLLLSNKPLLKKYGINLGSLKENTLLIRTIPQCLIMNNNHCNKEKILRKIYGLLNDILKMRTTNHANMLPLTIHNAIASEACHGAIKFGDELTSAKCLHLIKLLKNTKFPNRCAHGRPTVIPVMELSALEKRDTKKYEVL